MGTFFDDIFGDLDKFNSTLWKHLQNEIEEIEKELERGKLDGKWDIKHFDEPGFKGYVVQGRFWSDQPLHPIEPIDPFEPLRRPVPQRPFNDLVKRGLQEIRKPFTDVFDEKDAIRIYVELPGEEKDDIQLNVTEGNVEVKTKNFYTMIDTPTRNTVIDKASSKYKNGVLEVTIPKETAPETEKRNIQVD